MSKNRRTKSSGIASAFVSPKASKFIHSPTNENVWKKGEDKNGLNININNNFNGNNININILHRDREKNLKSPNDPPNYLKGKETPTDCIGTKHKEFDILKLSVL